MGDDDQGTTDPLRAWMGTRDWQVLKRASETEAAASLRRLLDEHEALFPDVDGENLARAAWALESVGKRGVPAVAIAWLQERPSQARLGVVLCLPAPAARGAGAEHPRAGPRDV
jgi:hypothetical protein